MTYYVVWVLKWRIEFWFCGGERAAAVFDIINSYCGYSLHSTRWLSGRGILSYARRPFEFNRGLRALLEFRICGPLGPARARLDDSNFQRLRHRRKLHCVPFSIYYFFGVFNIIFENFKKLLYIIIYYLITIRWLWLSILLVGACISIELVMIGIY